MAAEKLIQDIVESILILNTDRLSKEWVKTTLEANDDIQEEDLTLDADYEMPENFTQLCNLISQKCLSLAEQHSQSIEAESSSGQPVEARLSSLNLTTSGTNSHCLWTCLVEQQVEVQSLLALLRFSMEFDKVPDSRCFAAVNFYLSLLCVPGSSAFRIFNPMLYSKIMKILVMSIKFLSGSKKTKEKTTKRGRETPTETTDMDEEETTEITVLTSRETGLLVKEVLNTVDMFSVLAKYFSMKRIPKLVDLTVEMLTKLIYTFNLGILESVAEACSKFCADFHGKTFDISRRICTCVLPALALHPAEKSARLNEVLMAKDWSLNFLTRVMNKVGEPFYDAVHVLLQNICIRFVDRADSRTKTAQVLVDVLQQLPEDRRKKSLQWLLLFAFHEKAAYRLFALEYMSILLQVNQADYRLLAVIFSHCSDPSATIRAKALTLLADCTESNNPSVSSVFKAIFSRQQQDSRRSVDIVETMQRTDLPEDSEELLPTAESILRLLKTRVNDDKVHVRKSALQLLHAVVRSSPGHVNQDLLELLGRHCMDPSMLIRKQVPQALTDLVQQYPDHGLLRKMWVRYVLPQIFDSETRVQEKALECMQQLLLNGLRGQDELSWTLMETIAEEDMVNYLGKAVESWARQQLLKPQILNAVRQQIESGQHTSAAWTLLAALSSQMKWKENAFAVEYFEQRLRTGEIANLSQVIVTIAASISTSNAESLRKTFLPYLEKFYLPVDLIGPVFYLIISSYQHGVSSEDAAANQVVAEWAQALLTSCEQYIFSDIQQQHNSDEEQLLRRIITLGHAGLFCPKGLVKTHFLVLQHACFPSNSATAAPIASSQQPVSVPRQISPRNQAAAIASIGKICLQNEEMAKLMIPALGRLLDSTPHEAVRNNIVCVLCDLVVRYATAVDPVMPRVTACLRDPSPIVRKRTLVLLIHLLQEDYLKLKGTFLFRILQLVADDDPALRHLALFYFTQRLIPRQPKLLIQHFVECIFHYNEFQGHPVYNRFTLTDRERNLFTIGGTGHFKRRQQLYSFLLEHMGDEGRFVTTFKLANDVLGGAVGGVIPIDTPSGRAVLQDALSVLASEEIKLASLKATDEDDPVDAEEAAEAVKVSAKKAVISQVVKQNMIENVIPIVVELKQKLQLSPLVRNLMEFLRGLMKDYKDEIKEVLAADRQLVAEIEFDLKQYEQQRKSEMQRLSLANAAPLPVRANSNEAPDPPVNGKEAADPPANENEASDPPANGNEAPEAPANDDEAMGPPANPSTAGGVPANEEVPDSAGQLNGTSATPPEEEEARDELTELAPAKKRKTTSKRKSKAENSRVSTRSLRSRVVSTPIRGQNNDHVTFLDHDEDLSLIPHASVLQP